MQGFGNKRYDLPRPYAMKPKNRKMDRLATNYFTTPQRKLIGYIMFFILFSFVIIELIPEQDKDSSYEIEFPDQYTKSGRTAVAELGNKKADSAVADDLGEVEEEIEVDDDDAESSPMADTNEKIAKSQIDVVKKGSSKKPLVADKEASDDDFDASLDELLKAAVEDDEPTTAKPKKSAKNLSVKGKV